MRSSLYVALLLAVLAAAYIFYSPGRTRSANILLIVIDTLRADRLGCYGSPRGLTPFLDGLAKQGTVFVNAYSPTSWTCPAVASLLTSRYPSQHRVVGFASVLADEEVTLAEKLQPLGHVAGGFSANFRLLQSLGYAQGFQYWRADLPKNEDLRGDEIRSQSLQWLDSAWQASLSQPCFLYVHYMEPHAPYDPPEPYLARFQRRREGMADAAALNHDLVSMRWHELTRTDVQQLESLYDGEVAAVDAELKLLFDELDGRRFLENAIVIITADHGEEFWEHGGLTHGFSLYGESVRVPLILIAPGLAEGQRIEENVSLLDVAPTLLDLLGLPPEPRFEGQSLLPLLARPGAARRGEAKYQVRDVILQLEPRRLGLDVREHEAGIVRGAVKLLVRGGGFTEIYDLNRDPEEHEASPEALEGEAATLAEALEASRLELLTRAGAQASTAPIDEATREKLRALGYRY